MEKQQNYSKENQALLDKIGRLVDQQSYDQAQELIHSSLGKIESKKTNEEVFLTAELAGFLIDIGNESKNSKPAVTGLNIFKRNREQIIKSSWGGNYFYNVGNAYSTIYNVKLLQKEISYKPKSLGLLNQAKNEFWKAYKANEKKSELPLQPNFVVNLANALDQSGRVVEALQFYDIVLKKYPKFPKAHANRARALHWLVTISGTTSVNLIYQTITGYRNASQGKSLPDWMKKQFKEKADSLEEALKDHPGYDEFDFEHEEIETEKEFESLSDYRKFCLINHLALSEHALYCHCIGARRDDLMIATPSFPIKGEFVPVMEHYLNRVKSEYTISRLLFYRSLSGENDDWETYQEEVVYTELFDNEVVDINIEMLRSSYRLCFGILDKIAEAICELFDLAHKNEKIYFESFWRPRGSNLHPKQEERWEKINSINNPSLIALYSQACDLNSYSGEWSFFKKWRNALEHGLFVIRNPGNVNEDPFQVFDRDRELVYTDYLDFINKTLHLLRFTRSAIFNFVFCVRIEGRKRDNDQNGKPITLGYK